MIKSYGVASTVSSVELYVPFLEFNQVPMDSTGREFRPEPSAA
jgi:hypothetical protein